MKKDYDYYVSPRNSPHLKKHKFIHVLSFGLLAIDLVIFAILLPEIRAYTVALAVLFASFAIMKLFDRRKQEWAWWIAIFEIILAVGICVCYVLLFELYFFFTVLILECVVSVVAYIIASKKKWLV